MNGNVGALPGGFGEGMDPPRDIEMQIYDQLPPPLRIALGECVFDVSPWRLVQAVKKYRMTLEEVLLNLRAQDERLLLAFREEFGGPQCE